MKPGMLRDLSLLFALESCDADLRDDHDEALRLAAMAVDLRRRADAWRPRLVTNSDPPRAA